jgi:hypothetical protein
MIPTNASCDCSCSSIIVVAVVGLDVEFYLATMVCQRHLDKTHLEIDYGFVEQD